MSDPKPFFYNRIYTSRPKFWKKRKIINPKSIKWLNKYYKKHIASKNYNDTNKSLLSDSNKIYKKADWRKGYFKKKESFEMLQDKNYWGLNKLVSKKVITPIKIQTKKLFIKKEELEEEFLRREVLMYIQDRIHEKDMKAIQKTKKVRKKRVPKMPVSITLGGQKFFVGQLPSDKSKKYEKIYKELLPYKYIFIDDKCPYFVSPKLLGELFLAASSKRKFDFVAWAKKKSKKWIYFSRKAKKLNNSCGKG